jgi:hypothetical protein
VGPGEAGDEVTTRCHRVVACLIGVLAAGCSSPHSVLVRADFEDSAEQVDNAHYAAKVGASSAKDPALRCYAFEVLGKLRVADDVTLSAIGRVMSNRSTPDHVRAFAAWAAGEIARGMPWEERLRGLHGHILEALHMRVSGRTGYHLVEALGKYYVQHDHSLEENIQATKAMNALAASQTETLPGLFYAVINRVATLEVTVKVVHDAVEVASGGHSEQALLEVYSATLQLMRFFEKNQEKLLASFEANRRRIEMALQTALGGLELEQQRILTLMLTWYLARVANEPVLAQIVAARVAKEISHDDPTVRLVANWSVLHLQGALPARETLRGTTLTAEVEADVLRMVHAMWTGSDDAPDVLQQLFNVVPVAADAQGGT